MSEAEALLATTSEITDMQGFVKAVAELYNAMPNESIPSEVKAKAVVSIAEGAAVIVEAISEE